MELSNLPEIEFRIARTQYNDHLSQCYDCGVINVADTHLTLRDDTDHKCEVGVRLWDKMLEKVGPYNEWRKINMRNIDA